jgi:hypothetical protein
VLGVLIQCELAALYVRGVGFCVRLHFCVRSSTTKIVETGQTGTHAP